MSNQAPTSNQDLQFMRLLRTKFNLPRVHPDQIKRSHLMEKLQGGLDRKLILVSAPAGFGKTSLLTSWIQQNDIPTAWVSLDKRDNDPVRFWTYGVAALQTLQADLGETSLAMLRSPNPPPMEAALTELLNEIAAVPDDFLFALDDYQAIDNRTIHDSIVFLLNNSPAQMHLALASRIDPPLPLSTMRVRREVVEIKAGDLRFSYDETAAFLNQIMGFDLTGEEIDQLENKTEGWVAGLQLAALSMQSAQDVSKFIQSFSGGHRFVFDYLAHEVLQQLEQPLQDLLLKISILDRFNASLCKALTGREDSQDMLMHLEKANLFLMPLGQGREWYRFHHLFGDFLTTRLEEKHEPGLIADLHKKTSRWYAEQGLTGEAIEHAISGEDYHRAIELISHNAEDMFVRSELMTVLEWLEALPDKFIRAEPRLNIIRAWILLATARSEEVEPYLQETEKQLGVIADGSPKSMEQPPVIRGALGEIANIRASLAFNQMALGEVVRHSQHAEAYLDEQVESGLFNTRKSLVAVAAFNQGLAYEYGGQISAASQKLGETVQLCLEDQNVHLLPMATAHLAQSQILQGQLHKAAKAYQEGLHFVKETRVVSPLTGVVYTGLGNLYCEWNQLERAGEYLTEGIDIGKRWRVWEALLTGYIGLSRVLAARESYTAAMERLHELENLVSEFQNPALLPMVRSYIALMSARSGIQAPAVEWTETTNFNQLGDIPYHLEAEAVNAVRVMNLLGHPNQSLALIEKMQPRVEAGERWGRLVEILALQALALDSLGEQEESLHALTRSFSLAKPEGYKRLYLDEGMPMARLLTRARESPYATDFDNYIQELVAEFENIPVTRQAHPQDSGLAGLLSDREIEVLQLVAAGKTNQEIADDLYVSLNTVKTHVKNIYNKLDVRNRAEATSRALEKGI